ncbi:hypothetical protein [Rhodococcus sp. ARC_M6]|uniref:hypothetical protein n=1 Tax=Rhodococcus sp. ARC_M6 TaxID=2928852 RepID=UPI001FB4919E|nr:hypothetical protein [Rhodococcus sp. ARC_M6]MCJ0902762.1 hypothetical protein [Rhodococcus sp. ARC_M6]
MCNSVFVEVGRCPTESHGIEEDAGRIALGKIGEFADHRMVELTLNRFRYQGECLGYVSGAAARAVDRSFINSADGVGVELAWHVERTIRPLPDGVVDTVSRDYPGVRDAAQFPASSPVLSTEKA